MINKLVVWKKEYTLHNSVLDEQHKKLFHIINKISEIDDDDLKNRIKSILHDLLNYMNEHFIDEEKHMESIKYPQIDEHKKLHSSIKQELDKLLREKISIYVLKTRLKIFTKKVLIDHVLVEDMKIQAHYFKYKERISTKEIKVDTTEAIVDLND